MQKGVTYMVASQFIIWTPASTMMFMLGLAILIIIIGIALISVKVQLSHLIPIQLLVGITAFGLLGILVPHHWAIGDQRSRQSITDIRAKYPDLIVYNTSVNEHWAWVRWRQCPNKKAVQVPMHRQPQLDGHYWLTTDTLVVDKPNDHKSLAYWDDHTIIPPSMAPALCPRI
jgi:hypothetical protein